MADSSRQAAIVDFLETEDNIKFKPATVTRVLSTGFTHQDNDDESKTKLSKDAVLTSCEYLNIMTREAIHRSYNHAKSKESSKNPPTQVNVDDLQAIAGSIVLDF